MKLVVVQSLVVLVAVLHSSFGWKIAENYANGRRNRHMKTSLSKLDYLIKLRKQEDQKSRQDATNYTYKMNNNNNLSTSELCREARVVKCILKLEKRLKSKKSPHRKISFKSKCNAKEKFYKCVEKMHKKKCRNRPAMVKMAVMYGMSQPKLRKFLLSLRGCVLGAPS